MEFKNLALRSPDTRTGSLIARGVGAAASLAILLTGCGGSASSSESTAASTPQGHQGNTDPTLVFDDLGGGSSVIEVFPTPRSRQHDGTYYDGDSVHAICKTAGREVHSDPAVGELDRSSSEWIRIHGSPGEMQYASAVYTEHPKELLRDLPDC